MKNPLEDPFARRVREDANKAAARDAVEQELRDIEARIASIEHYISQGQTRPGDAEALERLRAEQAAKRAELHDYPM